MGTDKTRRAKQEWFEFMFRSAMMSDKTFLDLDQLLAEYCHNCMSTNKTGMQILKTFEKLGWIKMRGNELEVINVSRQREL